MVHPPQCCLYDWDSHIISVRLESHITPPNIAEDTSLTNGSFVAIFQCTPVSNYWMIGSPPDSCMDEGIATLICGIINCVADLATTVTPLPLIMGVSADVRLSSTTLTQ